MHHLVLGIDPSHVGLAPYAPVMRHALVTTARELHLKTAPEAQVCFLPIVAGFVGADAVAVALATRMDAGDRLRCAVDIGTNGEVVLTQDDVRQVQLAKCAIASGVIMLLHVAGLAPDDLDELMLAGGFGNYISIASALRIGLIPPVSPAKVRYVGNAASLGAQLCLVSEAERAHAAEVARAIEHVSLAAHPDFDPIFVDALNFPAR